MIWFNSKLKVTKGSKLALDQSLDLTKAVKSILKTDTVQITGFAEIGDNIENDCTVDEEFWEAFAYWQTTLEQTATKLKTVTVIMEKNPSWRYELTVFLQYGHKIIMISSHGSPVWYVRRGEPIL